jgi:hypothetical protein
VKEGANQLYAERWYRLAAARSTVVLVIDMVSVRIQAALSLYTTTPFQHISASLAQKEAFSQYTPHSMR